MSRLRQRTKQLMIAGLAGAGIVGLLFAGYAIYQARQVHHMRTSLVQEYESKIQELKEEKERRSVSGWVLARDISAGHPIRSEDLRRVELPADSVPANFMKSKEEIAGKSVKIALTSQTLLTPGLLYADEPTPHDLRWREMGFVQLPAALQKHDVVDVRIQFPTGQDYILLSKKKIEQLNGGLVTVTLNEMEILSLSSAVVDAYLHKASIYALAYVEPQLQAKAIPTYPANKAVLELIKKDPNIVSRAEHALSHSTRQILEADLSVLSPQNAVEFAGRHADRNAEAASSGDSFEMEPNTY
ncbi:SAF domain-containing protein [Paenibacillus woosongensis]|uniref:SAF domain-containing protein n=1 Tax=Paenibacillus woosongensis TaxID=307580 RepID=A0ABQ4MTX3_9BACL|nr:SAF domain-containing protein [Paenibacillus woosongensis]GIP59382.1 hypothetical protein J15TS10_31960 [Paenibacillus woosongensis]